MKEQRWEAIMAWPACASCRLKLSPIDQYSGCKTTLCACLRVKFREFLYGRDRRRWSTCGRQSTTWLLLTPPLTTPPPVALLAPVFRSDSERGPGASGPAQSPPSRRAMQIVPILLPSSALGGVGQVRARNACGGVLSAPVPCGYAMQCVRGRRPHNRHCSPPHWALALDNVCGWLRCGLFWNFASPSNQYDIRQDSRH